MKTKPSRKQIEAALTESFLKTIAKMDMEEDAQTLCRTFRAVLNIGFGIMRAGEAPDVVVMGQLDQVLRKTLGKRRNKALVTEPGTLGSKVLKQAKA